MGDSSAVPQLSTIDAFNCKKQLAGNEGVTLSDEEEGYITQEEFATLYATTNGGDAFNCKKQLAENDNRNVIENIQTLQHMDFLCNLYDAQNSRSGNRIGATRDQRNKAAVTHLFLVSCEELKKSMGDSSAASQLSTTDAFNCKKQLGGNGKLWSEDEEIAFLRSLGWEENDDDEDEGYITQKEFATLSATTNGGDAFNSKKQVAFNSKKHVAGNGKLWPEEEEIAFLQSLGWEENGDDDDEEEGYITHEKFVTLSATTNGGDALNCKKHVGNCELCLEEEEIAFLRSLGWEENGDEDDEEGDLTKEEIATFYTYASNHILQLKLKPKPALRFTRLHHNTAIFSFFT
nr:hypothetical protein DM860_012923 [Ipomoea batatas]